MIKAFSFLFALSLFAQVNKFDAQTRLELFKEYDKLKFIELNILSGESQIEHLKRMSGEQRSKIEATLGNLEKACKDSKRAFKIEKDGDVSCTEVSTEKEKAK